MLNLTLQYIVTRNISRNENPLFVEVYSANAINSISKLFRIELKHAIKQVYEYYYHIYITALYCGHTASCYRSKI